MDHKTNIYNNNIRTYNLMCDNHYSANFRTLFRVNYDGIFSPIKPKLIIDY
jgi:hypothetical protein